MMEAQMRGQLILICAVIGVANVSWSQARRQVSPQSASSLGTATTSSADAAQQIEAAAAGLSELNQSYGRILQTGQQMADIHASLTAKVGELCGIQEGNSVSPPVVAKTLEELCLTAGRDEIQYRELVSRMRSESRRFQTLSNDMKAKHDTAKAAINNVR